MSTITSVLFEFIDYAFNYNLPVQCGVIVNDGGCFFRVWTQYSYVELKQNNITNANLYKDVYDAYIGRLFGDHETNS